MKIKSSLISLCTLAVLSSACLKLENPIQLSTQKKSNRVTNDSLRVNQTIGDEQVKLQVISQKFLSESGVLPVSSPVAQHVIKSLPKHSSAAKSVALSSEKTTTQENSLVLGFPVGLVGEQHIFGGVITKVSDSKSEELGGLKLTDLSPLHVKTVVAPGSDGQPTLTLVGCAGRCAEDSEQSALISFPIVGLSADKSLLMVDLASIAQELDLVTMLDPKGEYTKLKTKAAATTSLDYSLSTLVFDVETKMIPVTADVNDASAPVTEFSVRWYLKLGSAFNPAFVSREPTEGVGFFKTERGATTKITRWSTTNQGSTVHYYIKNVPKQFRPYFAGALDNWNVEFKKILGREMLSYEFVEKTDPRHAQLIPGDIRFNIIEWDLYNKAGYGGLGPSIANQLTGETISANVLIQGPTIVDLYTKWFGVSERAREFEDQGKPQAAAKLIKAFNQEAQALMAERNDVKFAVKLGSLLTMNVHSQRRELEDPVFKGHFEIVPAGMTFDEYMKGYFGEMLAHELGHNMGLRHNFKGNLGAIENGGKGTVSRSIMEYLGRPFRHLNAIGLYDRMAIAYGYKGEAPKHLNWFCTDEDQGTNAQSLMVKSPECTKSDATSDPYSFWEGRLTRALDMVMGLKTTTAPIWKVEEIKSELGDAIQGLAAYALSAEKTSSTWTNFFGKSDRPEDPAEVKSYVLESFYKKLCDPALDLVVAGKESEEAKKLTQENLDALRKMVVEKTSGWKLFTSTDLSCN